MLDNTRHTRRRFLQTTGSAAAAMALAGCAGTGSNDGSNGSGNDGNAGRQTEIEQQENFNNDSSKKFKKTSYTIGTLDPIAAASVSAHGVLQQMVEGLTDYPNGKTNPKKLLTTDYSISDDYLTYEFKIKENVKFHNGKKLTANDFVYSWERLAGSPNSQRAHFILDTLGISHETITKNGEEMYKPNSLAVEAVDETTLKFELAQPYHGTLEMLAYGSFAVIPEGIVGDIKGYEGEVPYSKFAKSPKGVGTGPFKFKMWQQGTEAMVTRNKDWHGGDVTIAGVHWQILPNPATEYNYGMNKNSDVVTIPFSQYDPDKVTIEKIDNLGRKHGTYGPVRNGETLNYLATLSLSNTYIGFNMEKVPKSVRQAFAYVVNQNFLTKKTLKGRGESAYHFTPSAIYPGGPEAAKQHAKQKYPYGYSKSQIDKARQIMEEAGYGPDNQYTAHWTHYKYRPLQETAKTLRSKLASAHIQMEIQSADVATMITRGQNGKLAVYGFGWSAGWPSPTSFLQLLNPPQTQTEKQSAISYTNWSPELEGTTAAEEAIQAFNKIKSHQAPTEKAKNIRHQAYVKMEEANWEDVGYIPLFYDVKDRFWYDWAEIPPFGVMGPSNQTYDNVKIGQRS